MSRWRDNATMTPLRNKAKVYLNPIPDGGLSSLTDQDQFEAFVGKGPRRDDGSLIYPSRQAQMEASGWQMTMCNEFAGEFGRFITGGTYLGSLNLEDMILKSAKAYAWVDSDDDVKPQFGDIYYVIRGHRHLGVSCGVHSGRHYKVEAGQGGINFKQDFIKWTDSLWDPNDYAGWLDIDRYMGPAPSTTPLSPVGKWTVWGARRRYRWTYTFDGKGNVTWMDVFNGMYGGGTWRFDSHYLLIDWHSGSKDIWNLPVNFAGMTGIEDMKSEGTIDIQASKQ
jgi:hypothetical protein